MLAFIGRRNDKIRESLLCKQQSNNVFLQESPNDA